MRCTTGSWTFRDPAGVLRNGESAAEVLHLLVRAAGLVRREANDKGFLRHVTDDAGGIAAALAGHLLAVTGRRRVTLSQIFGKTAVNEGGGPDAERSPIRRLTLLRALLEAPLPAHQADIARRTGLREMTVGTSAAALSEVGLLGYKTQPTYTMRSHYQVTQPLPTATGSGNYALHNAAVDYINSRRTADAVIITRDELEAHLRTLPRWRDSQTLRDMLQRVMVRLPDHGHIVPLQDFVGQGHHTVVSLTSRQRQFLEDLVSGIDAIRAGDRHAIAHGQDQARRIIGDPARVRRLIAKAYGASKLATNPISAADKQQRTLAVLRAHDGATTEVVTAALSPDLSKDLVAGTLAELAKAARSEARNNRTDRTNGGSSPEHPGKPCAATSLRAMAMLAPVATAARRFVAPLIGRWRIVEMSGWDRDAIDLAEPGFIEFAGDGTGQFGFIAVRGWLDSRPADRGGHPGAEFTWEGVDEGDQVSGRGWAALVDHTAIEGHLFFHLGDDSSFRAEPFNQELGGQ